MTNREFFEHMKAKLIEMAINDTLPLDMNDLFYEQFEQLEKKPVILITVEGGVVQDVSTTVPCVVAIVDHDEKDREYNFTVSEESYVSDDLEDVVSDGQENRDDLFRQINELR
jgi:hypothetical protein